MFEADEFLRAAESRIAASAPLPDETLVVGIASRALRLRRRDSVIRWGGVTVAVALVAGMGFFAFLPGDDEPPVAPVSPSPTPTHEPSASPSPSVTADEVAPTLIEGFAPIPQLPATEIPWDDVGPGWFTVSHYDEAQLPQLDLDETYVYPRLEGGVSVVSPDGTWYAANLLAELGPGTPLTWDGDAMFMATRLVGGPESAIYDVNVVDLATGEALGTDTGVPWEHSTGVGRGQAMVWAWGGDGLVNVVTGAGAASMGGCSDANSGYWGWEADDMSFLISPDGGGRLVCFGPAVDNYERTSVTLVNVPDVASSTVINEFQFDAYRYSFTGWLDRDTFFFARTQENATGAEQMFLYDLRDDSIAEVDLPIYEDLEYGTVQGYFHQASQRHVFTRVEGAEWSISLYETDGSLVSSVSGQCAEQPLGRGLVVKVSGERLLALCEADGHLHMVDLVSGAMVGEWEVGANRGTLIAGHRAE